MSTKKLQIIDSLVKNAETLNGKRAEEFASASDVETLKSQVGDTSVSEQINEATSNIYTKPQVDKMFDNTISSNGWTPKTYLWVNEDGRVVGRDVSFTSGMGATVNNETLIIHSTAAIVDGETLKI